MFKDTIRNPSVIDFIDRTLEEAPFSSKHILNFLHNGPPEDRPADVPDFDWRDIFNLTDRVIRMLNQYGEVSGQDSKTFIIEAFPFSRSQKNYLCVSNATDWTMENVHQRVELNRLAKVSFSFPHKK